MERLPAPSPAKGPRGCQPSRAAEDRPRTFLRAEWRQVVLLNYQLEAAALAPLVPAGAELDPWHGADSSAWCASGS